MFVFDVALILDFHYVGEHAVCLAGLSNSAVNVIGAIAVSSKIANKVAKFSRLFSSLTSKLHVVLSLMLMLSPALKTLFRDY